MGKHEKSSSFNTSSSDKVGNLCFMERQRQKNTDVSNSDTHSLSSYNELSKVFHEMHDDALKTFKKKISK